MKKEKKEKKVAEIMIGTVEFTIDKGEITEKKKIVATILVVLLIVVPPLAWLIVERVV